MARRFTQQEVAELIEAAVAPLHSMLLFGGWSRGPHLLEVIEFANLGTEDMDDDADLCIVPNGNTVATLAYAILLESEGEIDEAQTYREQVEGDIEQMKPKLVQGVKINKFAPDINFVEFDGRYIKMDDADNQLLSEFDGSSTLADVIAKYLAKGDTGVFNRVLSLITRLNKADLFDKECASVLKDQKKIDTPFFYH